MLLLLLLPLQLLSAKDIQNSKKNIGICVMATGRYDSFIEPLVESARQNFCTDHNVTFFVFTDGTIPQAKDIVRIQQSRLGWPYDTMLRPEVYFKNRTTLQDMDYLFSMDADMRITGKVGKRILSDLVGTQHPGFYSKRGTYETNPNSVAYVEKNEGEFYFAGGFWGGTAKNFLQACKQISKNIRTDMDNGIMPLWHDESHLNRYFIDNPPTRVLTPAYCYWEGKVLPFKQRIVALNKDHSQYRK